MALPCIMAWSGGKDSALALERVLSDPEYRVEGLLTTLHGTYRRISMHGVREGLLDQQAKGLGLPLFKVFIEGIDAQEYERKMREAMKSFQDRGVQHVVFGDIFLEDLRGYREEELGKEGMEGVFPIWKEDTNTLLREAFDRGIRTVLCTCREGSIDPSFLGKILTPELAASFPDHVDPCGEYGEFHSYVIDAPSFGGPIGIRTGEEVVRSFEDPEDKGSVRFHYLDLLLELSRSEEDA